MMTTVEIIETETLGSRLRLPASLLPRQERRGGERFYARVIVADGGEVIAHRKVSGERPRGCEFLLAYTSVSNGQKLASTAELSAAGPRQDLFVLEKQKKKKKRACWVLDTYCIVV